MSSSPQDSHSTATFLPGLYVILPTRVSLQAESHLYLPVTMLAMPSTVFTGLLSTRTYISICESRLACCMEMMSSSAYESRLLSDAMYTMYVHFVAAASGRLTEMSYVL